MLREPMSIEVVGVEGDKNGLTSHLNIVRSLDEVSSCDGARRDKTRAMAGLCVE
jgi:hypothetical protein